MPFFSVIIPLYNKEKFVENAVRSILAQTFTDYEIIIVDDCSTDKSLEIASGIISDTITIIRHDKNKGLSASRNTGIKAANAYYITLLDADDLWKPNYLEKLFSLIQEFPEAALFGTNYEELYPGNKAILPANNVNLRSDGIVSDFFASNLGQPIYCSCSICISRNVFEKIGYYNENITFGEDVDFNIRANSEFKVAYSPEALVSYTMFSENQITNTNLKNKTITDFDSYETLAKENKSLKKYLDFNRYIMARNYQIEGDVRNFTKMKSGINPNPEISGLNAKQRFLLNAPAFISKWLKQIKAAFIKKGIRFTTFG